MTRSFEEMGVQNPFLSRVLLSDVRRDFAAPGTIIENWISSNFHSRRIRSSSDMLNSCYTQTEAQSPVLFKVHVVLYYLM